MLALLLFVACASENSCERYVTAAADCSERAGGDGSVYDAEAICGDWDADKEKVYGAWYACQADAWEASDCASADDVTAAADAANDCPAG